jgi:hypothetical protein
VHLAAPGREKLRATNVPATAEAAVHRDAVGLHGEAADGGRSGPPAEQDPLPI